MLITIRNLVKSIEKQPILNGVQMDVGKGELVALLGASGSGKTTLLRCLTLQEKWDQGHFIYEGTDILKLSDRRQRKYRRKWVFIDEKPELILDKTAVQNVLKGRANHTSIWRTLTGKVKMDEYILAMDFLEKVGLLDKAEKKVSTLSGGEKQRVAIAKALIQGAELVVADEPISGLDPANTKKVMLDLQQICKTTNVAIVCSLQQVDLAETYATRILGLSDGRIVLDIKRRRLTGEERDLVFGE